MKTYYLLISKETCDYLQRLNFEIETRQSVVSRLIENAKDNVDASVLESVPFKNYHKELEEAVYSYQTAKDELSKVLGAEVLKKEGKDVPFSWMIEDFHEPKAKITIEVM